ncbi:MAG: restriction endonuclease [Methanomassiliicoccales archaeon]|nr:restriction endonuclease [Methanomassiliicoccales archaeon]
MPTYVIKRSGEREEFDEAKVRTAIMRSDATAAEAEEILKHLKSELYDGITTELIYRHVHEMLQGRKAIKFGLKKAILRLGPEGENFERFMARVYEAEGYRTILRSCIKGKCVQHEVDIILEKDRERVMVECKFHNSLGLKSNIQCTLYTYARFLDLKPTQALDHPCLATNTRFTSDAIEYADCVGMRLLGWRYPEGAGLEQLVEKHALYPITILEMHRSELGILLGKHFLLAKDILDRRDEVESLLSEQSASSLISQVRQLLPQAPI